jgi:hypothetical protein
MSLPTTDLQVPLIFPVRAEYEFPSRIHNSLFIRMIWIYLWEWIYGLPTVPIKIVFLGGTLNV